MAHLDVAARLADGRTAVEHTQTYVDACRALGYQHPDLTAHGSQVRDWYDAEVGLDLGVLDADCAALWAAVNATEEALAIQRTQAAELAATWRGHGADSATQFLQRHCESGATVAAAIRTAAERCSALCDELWRIVDAKVATAIAVDDRSLARRPAWLAAAHTISTGIGDRSAAEEMVRQELIPHVDNDIREDWLIAMRSSADAAAACYDATIDALAAIPRAYFEIPGDLGPQPPLDQPPAPMVMSPAVMPAASTIPAAAPPPSPLPAPPAPPPAPPPDGMLDGLGPVPPLSDLTAPLGDGAGMSTGSGNLGGLGGLPGSIGGVVGKIADGIGALIGSLADGLAGPEEIDDPLLDDPVDLDDDPLEDADETGDGTLPDDEPEDTEPADADEEPVIEESTENPVAAKDVDSAAEPPGEPPPPAQPEMQPEGETPCQIAADELPQAGQ